MLRRTLLAVVPAVAVGVALPARSAAQTPYTLPAYCTANAVPQTWGDAPGVANFSYDVRSGFGAGRTSLGSLNGWGPGYSDLPCAFWGGASNEPSWVGEIAVVSDGTSNTILLEEITIGRWSTGQRDVAVRVYDDTYSSLLFSGGLSAVDGTSNTLLINEVVAGPIRIQWNDPWWMGVGRVELTIDPSPNVVPEPATLSMLALGVALGGAAVHRRRQG